MLAEITVDVLHRSCISSLAVYVVIIILENAIFPFFERRGKGERNECVKT